MESKTSDGSASESFNQLVQSGAKNILRLLSNLPFCKIVCTKWPSDFLAPNEWFRFVFSKGFPKVTWFIYSQKVGPLVRFSQLAPRWNPLDSLVFLVRQHEHRGTRGNLRSGLRWVARWWKQTGNHFFKGIGHLGPLSSPFPPPSSHHGGPRLYQKMVPDDSWMDRGSTNKMAVGH